MAKLNLKNIVGKKSDASALVLSLLEEMDTASCIEDADGKLLLGNAQATTQYQYPISLNDEFLGWVKGDEKAIIIANLISHLLQKEAERKKLGSEVLNLYQEVNLIFDFSERLAKTIEASAISQVTLDEASRVIRSNNGVVVLWDDNNKKLHVAASAGELFFAQEKINSQLALLLKIIFSGQSEIISDISQLKEAGVILPKVQSVIYSALKVKHRIMGAIILASNEPVQYTAADLKLLTTLALQSSAAIETAMLYEKNIREVKEREEAILRIHEVTKKFVPNEFIRSLGKETLTDVRLGDQVEKIVTVLFTDIRDFTTLSEKMTPEENFHFVSSFNARLGPIIRSNKGFINQYLGDSIMAIFPESAEDALHAAINMQKAVHELNQERIAKGLPVIKSGIGMHTGPLIMGITGDEFRLDAATISDTVNTASRIESLTKYYKSPLLLSKDTQQYINGHYSFYLRQLGSVRLKGKHNLLSIVECMNGFEPEQLEKKLTSLPYFNEAMNFYHEHQFQDAIRLFQLILATDPEDQTVKFFMENAIKYNSEGVPENWTGAQEMLSK